MDEHQPLTHTGALYDTRKMKLLFFSARFGKMQVMAARSSFGAASLGSMTNKAFELLRTTPRDACEELPRQTRRSNHTGFAAFVKRGQCPFEEKVRRVMQNGGAFVVIADNTFESDIVLAHMNMVCCTNKSSHFHSHCKQQQATTTQTEQEARNAIPAVSVRLVDAMRIESWLSYGPVHMLVRD